MKNLKLRKGKVAIMSVTICILMFSLIFSTIIPEYSEKVTKNEPNFLLRDVQASANPSAFLSVWNTTLTSSGSSGTNQVKLPLETGGIYDFTVNWGDSSSDTITDWDQAEVTHTYSSEGVYEVNITGTIVGWRFNNGGDKLKLLEISQWGNLSLGNSGSYFKGCTHLNLTTTDILNLTGTTTLYSTFYYCKTLGNSGNLSGWNVSSVTNMANMFSHAYAFNQNISGWDVSNVIYLSGMFYVADTFNQDIGGWNVSNVIQMSSMFSYADTFNQGIGGWNVSSVTNMGNMFSHAYAFNQNISGWDVSKVIDMREMFDRAYVFNQDIGGWNVSKVSSMSFMFSHAFAFNQDISEWNVSKVIYMRSMFSSATAFNQNIGGWNVSNVIYIENMFDGATAFNQDVGGWNVSSVVNMENMFQHVTLTTDNYDNLLIEWAKLLLQSGVSFSAGNSMYSSAAIVARQYIIDTYGWTIDDYGLNASLNPPVLITTSQTIIKENITIEWNNVENATSYYIYVNGIFNETTSDTSQVVMLWSNGSYNITVTSVIGILESDESEPIIIVVELPSGNGGDPPEILGYNFALIPTMLLGWVIVILKIRKRKNQYSQNQ